VEGFLEERRVMSFIIAAQARRDDDRIRLAEGAIWAAAFPR
jgi:hypothetical protein